MTESQVEQINSIIDEYGEENGIEGLKPLKTAIYNQIKPKAGFNRKYVYQTIKVTIPAATQGTLEFVKKTFQTTDVADGITIPAQSSGFAPGFNFLLSCNVENGFTFFESLPVELLVSSTNIQLDKRFISTHIDSNGNNIVFTVDVGTTPTPAAFTFYIVLRLIRKSEIK